MRNLILAILLTLLSLAPNIAEAQLDTFSPHIRIGTGLPGGTGGWRTDNLNAAPASARHAYGFLAPESCTLDEVCIYVAAKTGTLAATDATLNIYSSAAGVPNAVLSTATFDANTTGFKCITVSQAVVQNTQYFFDFSNANGTPASNHYAITTGPQNVVIGNSYSTTAGGVGLGPVSIRSTNNGGAWSAGAGQRGGAAPYRVHCSSGAYYGYPAQTGDTPSNPVTVADRVYGTNEVANLFTTDAGPTQNVLCVEMEVARIGTPTGNLIYRLYEGTTHIADTVAIASMASIIQPGAVIGCFATPQALAPETAYRIALAETTQADANSNAIGPHRVDFHNSPESLALKPLNGTIQKSVCTGSCDGGTWTDTPTSFYLMNYILDPAAPFTVDAGGGGGSAGNQIVISGRTIYTGETTAAERRLPLYIVDVTDGETPEAGLTISGAECRISKNGAAAANCAGTIGEVETGTYYYELAAAEHNTVGYVEVSISEAAGKRMLAYANITGIDLTGSAVPATVAGTVSANVVSVNSGAIQNADFAARGTAQAVAAGTITLDAVEAFGDDALNDHTAVHVVSATTGAGQTACICDYVGATDVATLCDNWTITPTGTVTYNLIPVPNCDGGAGAVPDPDVTVITGTAQTITGDTTSVAGMRLEASSAFATGLLNDHSSILITASSGNGAAVGQVMCVRSNVLANDVVTFNRAWKSVPSGTVEYAIIPTPNCNTAKWPLSR